MATTFTTTSIKGDGPVVKVPFTSYNVELIPVFSLTNGQYWVCMTDSGGYYKSADYDAESKLVKASNDSTKNNTRRLIRMMKRWQAYCSVPIMSFWIELVVIDFLDGWAHSEESSVYYDWMIRDFLTHLEGKANSTVYAPGTYEAMDLGDAWLSKARMARQRAEKACDHEADYPVIAGEEWQKIFGTDIPKIRYDRQAYRGNTERMPQAGRGLYIHRGLVCICGKSARRSGRMYSLLRRFFSVAWHLLKSLRTPT